MTPHNAQVIVRITQAILDLKTDCLPGLQGDLSALTPTERRALIDPVFRVASELADALRDFIVEPTQARLLPPTAGLPS